MAWSWVAPRTGACARLGRDGVTVELAEDPSLDRAAAALHVRVVCADLQTSVNWYREIGFELSDVRERVPRGLARVALAVHDAARAGSLTDPDG